MSKKLLAIAGIGHRMQYALPRNHSKVGKDFKSSKKDAFDVTMQHSRWLAKLGAVGFDLLILLNSAVNFILLRLGKQRISFATRIKKSVKKAVSFVNSFEDTVAQIASDKGFSTVICGHIHQPADKLIQVKNGHVRYLNSGDWIENLTALEYNNHAWEIVEFAKLFENKKVKFTEKQVKQAFADAQSVYAVLNSLTKQEVVA
jgi:UDP-2,3-diacylglucosamine pyrophosphatase LpxH